jgi:uncharacterized membrane protein
MLKQVLRDLFSSKKAVAAMASIGVIVANSVGLTALSETALTMILATIATFIFGQGLADFGKEKAKIEVE